MFHADLHIHSGYSRACSKNCDAGTLAWWAVRKGITVVGTGDFTHPAWAGELAESLEPAEPGLLRLRPGLQSELARTTPASCDPQVRFLLSAEISTIYKRDGVTRKVHHLLYAPTFEAAGAITAALSKIGNLASDGRPILGLDSRHLMEITLNAGPGCYLVPAHIWTPWFAVLGSKSGFDAVADCYLDLADHVFAVETGLSSDPPMNWMCSALDRYRLVSNSDAHSPPMIGREATTFSTGLDYFAMAEALRTGSGLVGTINFHPEGGRYHLDGHRKCGVRFEPRQTNAHSGTCPGCGKPLTIGVLHRVSELADRTPGYRPAGTAGFINLVSLPEIVGEISGSGPKSKKVIAEVDRLVATFGPELRILCETDLADLRRTGGSLLGEAIARLRRGEVIKEAGYDGEYGVIRLMRPEELAPSATLFDLPTTGSAQADGKTPAAAATTKSTTGTATGTTTAGTATTGTATTGTATTGTPTAGTAAGTPSTVIHGTRTATTGQRPAAGPGLVPERGQETAGPGGAGDVPAGVAPPGVSHLIKGAKGSLLDSLDHDQRAAAEAAGPLMIIAGPGTGKTRTLTYRIAAQIAERDVPPQACLALTFTRRAAREVRERLEKLVPAQAARPTVTTFHGLGLMILREHAAQAGLTPDFGIADEQARLDLAAEKAGSQRGGRQLLAAGGADPERRAEFSRALAARDLVDFDGLVELPVTLLGQEPALAAELRERWPLISVDEYQDIDATQYALLRLLSGDGGGLTVIGDPDQAIYGFRGADVGFFLRFGGDYPGATTVYLTRNYRSAPVIVSGALQAIAPSTLVPGRILRAAALTPERPDTAAPTAGAPAITVHEAGDEHGEAAWIAEAIDRLLGGSSFHSLDTGRADGHAVRGLALADIAVLYRTDAQAGPLGQAVSRAGLPFQKRSHDLLQRRTAVPEIVREMCLADPACADGHDGTVAGRLAVAVRRLAGRDAVGQVPTDHSAAGQASASHGTAGQVSAVDVLAAGEVLAPLARRCDADLERFLTEIALGAEADALDPRADAISLLTMHAAKGLEFSAVFLAGCERGLLPLWLPGGGARPADGEGQAARPDPDPAEERRLLFVGMTRARTHLFLTSAAKRRRHGTVTETGPSPFLAAISKTLLSRTSPPRPRRPADRQLRLL
jgi:DNA helicase-2/ATP-dependent DNA helicase PcrA